MTALSNSDAMLVAVPMIGLLVICHFRIDELFGKPKKGEKLPPRARGFAQSEEDAGFLPDGRFQRRGQQDVARRAPRVSADID